MLDAYHVFWVNKGIIDCQKVQSILDTDAAYDPTNSTKPAINRRCIK